MINASFPAMGTTFDVVARDEGAVSTARKMVAAAEAGFSRFLPSSELSAINRSEDLVVKPSKDLGEVLRAGERARSISGGLVDIGVGRSLVEWGYDRPFVEMNGAPSEVRRSIDTAGWWFDDVGLHRDPGVLIDLGGVAKGWTCDQVVEAGVATVLSGGGDVRSDDPSCVVRVLDPWGGDVAMIPVGVGGLATSASTRRTWTTTHGPAHHIIDPRTGAPADSPVLSASVVADTAVDAEVGAKTVLLLGAEGLAWASQQSWIRSALVVWHDGAVFGTSTIELAS